MLAPQIAFRMPALEGKGWRTAVGGGSQGTLEEWWEVWFPKCKEAGADRVSLQTYKHLCKLLFWVHAFLVLVILSQDGASAKPLGIFTPQGYGANRREWKWSCWEKRDPKEGETMLSAALKPYGFASSLCPNSSFQAAQLPKRGLLEVFRWKMPNHQLDLFLRGCKSCQGQPLQKELILKNSFTSE